MKAVSKLNQSKIDTDIAEEIESFLDHVADILATEYVKAINSGDTILNS
ncbi:MAG: hypothetical protein HYW47_01725 [Deltaproteobacteria bacterium]|nr:hypothetical protein [Deltaproteobacteria bacterium]